MTDGRPRLVGIVGAGFTGNLTGRDQPYEVPEDPALVLRTAEVTAEDAADRVLELVLQT
ncbi:MAG TPA: hypothetical protein VGI94_08940 [Reyranella sp.]|jgi:adenylylsulfate kinase-like enzyme